MYKLIFYLAIFIASITGNTNVALQSSDTKSKFNFNDIVFVNDYTFVFDNLPSNIQITNLQFEIELNNSFCNVYNVKHTEIPWSLLCSTKCNDQINEFGQKTNSLIVKSLGPSTLNAVITLSYNTILDDGIYQSSTGVPVVVIFIPIIVGIALIILIMTAVVLIRKRAVRNNSTAYIMQS